MVTAATESQSYLLCAPVTTLWVRFAVDAHYGLERGSPCPVLLGIGGLTFVILPESEASQGATTVLLS